MEPEPITKEYCAMRMKSVNFLLTSLAVIVVTFLGMASWSVSIANETSSRMQQIEATVNHQLGENEQFRERVLTDLQEIKTHLKHLQERGY
jgi:hypothetical protein